MAGRPERWRSAGLCAAAALLRPSQEGGGEGVGKGEGRGEGERREKDEGGGDGERAKREEGGRTGKEGGLVCVSPLAMAAQDGVCATPPLTAE